MPASAQLPLDGVRILEVGTMIAAPYATAILGDLGATIVKVEPPVGDALRQSALLSGTHFRFNEPNRNKRAICLDIGTPSGAAMFARLVTSADVVVCNLRPDVIDKLGVGYTSLRAVNEEVISIRLSAFGATGPDAQRRGTAPTIDGASGLATLNGYPDRDPLRPAGFYPDLTAALFAAYAVLAALRHRDLTGEGQEVDVAMTECAAHLVGEALMAGARGEHPRPEGNRHPDYAPHNCYPGRETGSWIAIAVRSDADWDRLDEHLGRPDWSHDYRSINDRKRHEDDLDRDLAAHTARYPLADLVAGLLAVGVDVAAVAEASDVLADPQLAHRGYYRTVTQPGVGDGPLPRFAVPCPYSGGWRATPAVAFAQDTDAVLGELPGVTPADLDRLYAEGGSTRELRGSAATSGAKT